MAMFCMSFGMSASGGGHGGPRLSPGGEGSGAGSAPRQEEHPLVFAANHMFVDLAEGRFLVDTGSPLSFARSGRVTFAGEARSIPKSMLGLDLDAICSGLGLECDGLLGTDLLGACDTCWDGPGRRFLVHAGEPRSDAVRVPYQDMLGTPVVEARIGGRTAACVFDTGAQYGYVLDRTLAAGGAADGTIDDFNPVIGRICSEAWRIPVELRGIRFDERFGLLDTLSAGLLGALGAEAIIGCSWLPSKRVWFMPRRGQIAIA